MGARLDCGHIEKFFYLYKPIGRGEYKFIRVNKSLEIQ